MSVIDFTYLEEIPVCNSLIGNYKSKINSITWINDNSFNVKGILNNGKKYDVILERDFDYVRGYFR
ncbi:hypothetical protein CLTEP_27870 [Clostridium tepidiprofundi DSM 19306]|uniref:Uncharacterized protein n=1 Tax=Clostridium tepidiprofundi DSM 19306 TaxID=1121338 RepID=A0A151AI54_9CLOT|nr:hypothetical protein [Clostridium tepidiprofundi]KYH27303.1 hypothetical protein CLTEP_27870 [Clostridium tepidiprofundi DSM 19306]